MSYNPTRNKYSESPTAPIGAKAGDIWFNSGTVANSGINSKVLATYDGAMWKRLQTYPNPVVCSREITTAGQSLASGGITKIQWNGAVTDTHNAWDTVNNQFIVPEDGIYLIYARVRIQSTNNAAGNLSVFLDIYKSGALIENLATFLNYQATAGVLTGSRPHGIGVHGLGAGESIDIRSNIPSYYVSNTISGGIEMQKLKIIKIGEL